MNNEATYILVSIIAFYIYIYILVYCKWYISIKKFLKPLERPRRMWEDNIRMDLGEKRVAWCGMS
jgi:hypothetical protein